MRGVPGVLRNDDVNTIKYRNSRYLYEVAGIFLFERMKDNGRKKKRVFAVYQHYAEH